MSWGATGVLLIKSKDKLNQVVKVLVSRPGDVYMCGGLFQQRLEHAVPPVREWPQILEQHRAGLLQLEISAMEEEIRSRHVERVRHHINVRWHTNHYSSCSQYKSLQFGGFVKLGMQASITVASSAAASAGASAVENAQQLAVPDFLMMD